MRYLLVSLALLATPVFAEESPPRTIVVSGEGTVYAPPDLAIVSFGVETAAPTAGAAMAENTKKSTALVDAIKQALGPRDKVSTTQYALSPVYEQHERPTAGSPPRITGYIASNTVRVELRDVNAVGALIDTATRAGANRADRLEFTLEERSAAQSEALQRAGADARRQAEATAAALGLELGRILNATTGGAPIIAPKAYGRGMVAMAEAAPPIEAGDVGVSAQMQVTFEIR